ncbi:MAG: adenylate/guanylate cyclase domain-containing protein [Desulfobacterales bacterium]|jgi:class 3 adenylate cyclase
MKPSVQFVKRKDGVTIAYSIFGTGPPLIMPPPWVTSLSFITEDPFTNQFLEGLAQNMMVVFYDKHGCGQSDRNRKEFTLESELLDLETIVDHIDLEEFNLFGASMSGPPTIAYTARHPKRVMRLILYGTYANGETLAKKEVQAAIISLIKASWGLGSKTLADVFIPGANSEELQSLAEFQRLSSSSDIAAKLLKLCYSVDVTKVLSSIKPPTLILHRENDKAILIHHGRQLAAEIPDAHFKILSGDSHPPWYGESREVTDEVLDFVGIARPRKVNGNIQDFSGEESETAEQATIVFSDIVSSTDLVNSLGDAAARDIFLQHDKIIREKTKKFNGTELQNLGDGFMLSFESATSAIKCACAIQKEIAQKLSQIHIRIGINTGEVIKREGRRPFGQAVVLTSRIVSECEGGQILISDISKQLAAGGKFNFSEKGKFNPKGFDDSIKLHEVFWKE